MRNFKKIKLLIMDCDGVLTDGKIVYTENGWESKAFNVADGLGIKVLRFAGIKTAIITGRESEALKRRCQDLKIDFLCQNVRNKVAAVSEILEKLSLSWDNTAYIGDDWNDYPALIKAGISAAPQQAPKEIKKAAGFITGKEGGSGAVREFIEYILKQQGVFDEVIERFLDHLNKP